MKPKRIRIRKNTRVPVRSTKDFIDKLMELGYSKREAINKYKFINIKCDAKYLFR
jgi:hypothetical protein